MKPKPGESQRGEEVRNGPETKAKEDPQVIEESNEAGLEHTAAELG